VAVGRDDDDDDDDDGEWCVVGCGLWQWDVIEVVCGGLWVVAVGRVIEVKSMKRCKDCFLVRGKS
jgi:hypothetical protein